MIIELTFEQRQKLGSQTPRVRDPETPDEYVLVRASTYDELLRKVLDMDEPNPDDYLPYVNELMAEDDADDPLLEKYQKFRKAP